VGDDGLCCYHRRCSLVLLRRVSHNIGSLGVGRYKVTELMVVVEMLAREIARWVGVYPPRCN
jgi:hypothetical protein